MDTSNSIYLCIGYNKKMTENIIEILTDLGIFGIAAFFIKRLLKILPIKVGKNLKALFLLFKQNKLVCMKKDLE